MVNVLRILFRGLWDEVLVELLRGGFKGGRELFAERVKSYIQTNPRAALVITLLSLEPEERANLMEAHRRAMREGWENRFVVELGQALPRKPDGSVNEERAQEILKQLNEVSTEELGQFLEFLNHDPIAQWLRAWVLGKGQEAVVGMTAALAELAAHGVNVAEKFPKAVAFAAAETDRWATNTAAPAVRRFRISQRWIWRSRRRQLQLEGQRQVYEERLRDQREEDVRRRVMEVYEESRRYWTEQSEEREFYWVRRGGRQ